MKRIILSVMTLLLLLTAPVAFAQEPGQTGTQGFSVSRMLIAGSIENREPVDVTQLFSSEAEKAYCFVELKEIEEDTDISFAWYFNEQEVAKVTLPVKQGTRWRTYSSKKLAGLKGTWQVVLQDSEGTIVRTVEFNVE